MLPASIFCAAVGTDALQDDGLRLVERVDVDVARVHRRVGHQRGLDVEGFLGGVDAPSPTSFAAFFASLGGLPGFCLGVGRCGLCVGLCFRSVLLGATRPCCRTRPHRQRTPAPRSLLEIRCASVSRLSLLASPPSWPATPVILQGVCHRRSSRSASTAQNPATVEMSVAA